MHALQDVQEKATLCAEKLGVGPDALPSFGRGEDGRPHVEVDDRGYHYVYIERNIELSRVTTQSMDELLFHIFQEITFGMAYGRQRAKSAEMQGDLRRFLFPTQLNLLRQLAPAWADRQAAEQAKILKKNPFDDHATTRAARTRELREAGHPPADAWRQACEEYPLP